MPLKADKDDEDAVQVRVSKRTPRGKPEPRTPISRAQLLATGLLEAVIGQVADYIESSPAVERLIRAQTRQVLHELARAPEFNDLIKAQARQYIVELAAHPEILETLVRAQAERAASSDETPPASASKSRKRKPRKTEITLE